MLYFNSTNGLFYSGSGEDTSRVKNIQRTGRRRADRPRPTTNATTGSPAERRPKSNGYDATIYERRIIIALRKNEIYYAS